MHDYLVCKMIKRGGSMFRYGDCLLFNLSKATQKVDGIFRSCYQPYNLTSAQVLVLEVLYEEEGLSAGEVGKRSIIDSSTLTGVLDRLSEGGWITKKTTDEDKRLLEINLTEKALQFKDELLEVTENINRELLNMFKMEEGLLLFRILQDLRKK
jgi:DNA-binding MarR family transcriptional regulator